MYNLLNSNVIKLVYDENKYGKIKIGTRKLTFLNKIDFYVYHIKKYYQLIKEKSDWFTFTTGFRFLYLSDTMILVDTGSGSVYGINFDTPINELDSEVIYKIFRVQSVKKSIEKYWRYWWIPTVGGRESKFSVKFDTKETFTLDLWEANAKTILRNVYLKDIDKEIYLQAINDVLKEKGYNKVFTKEELTKKYNI